MRRKSLVLIVIAAGCGLIASIGISQVLDGQKKTGEVEIETVEIFVTTAPVSGNDVFTRQLVKLEKWPKDKVPPGAITDWETIDGRRPNVNLHEGEPIVQDRLFDPNETTVAADRIPPGYRVLPVKVTADMTSGLVQPGDMVDVLVVLRQGGAVSRTVAKTILQKVSVFAVNEHIIRKMDVEGNVIQAKTVSLTVTPDQVEVLTLAHRMGDLSLSIRPPNDDTLAMEEGTGLEKLLGGASEEVPDPTPAQTAQQSDAAKFLQFAAGAQQAAPRLAMSGEPKKMMVVYEPEITRVFELDPDGGPALEVTPGLKVEEPVAEMDTDIDLDEFEPPEEEGLDESVETHGELENLPQLP
jgi:pilus assembly protein CpaB